jgi:hypothetical protein
MGERPHHDARLWLIEPPALRLFVIDRAIVAAEVRKAQRRNRPVI